MKISQDARTVRAAENQSIFRDVNERIEELYRQHTVFSEVGEWVCECADTSCTERISMTIEEYQRIRAHPNQFAVAAGHEIPEVEVVVEATDRFLVVRKVGSGAQKARQLDPRSD
jgi:hypothetical protein